MNSVTFNADQLLAVAHPSNNLRVEAGPGAGKTEVVAARIADFILTGRFRASEIVALTFTRSMALDLRRRVTARLPADAPCAACGGQGSFPSKHEGDTGFDCGECGGAGKATIGTVSIGTLHGLAAGWIRQALRGELEGMAAIMALGLVKTPDFSIALPEDVEDRIKAAQEAIGTKKITQKALREGLTLTGPALLAWPVESEARRQLRLHDMVSYDDLLVMLHAMVAHRGPPTGAPTLGERFKCLFVDERQDLSARHWRIIRGWAPRCITHVGDDAQAIYGFLGRKDGAAAGDVEAERLFFDQPSDVVKLGVNYRSGPALVHVAHEVRSVLAQMGACTDMALVPATDKPASYDFIRGDAAAVDPVGVVMGIHDAGTGPLGDIAILASTHDQLDEAAAALDEASVPWVKLERSKATWSTELGRVVVAMARAADGKHWTRHDAITVMRALGLEHSTLVDEAELYSLKHAVPLATGLDEVFGTPEIPSKLWRLMAEAPSMEAVGKYAGIVADGGFGQGRMGPGFARVKDALDEWMPTRTDGAPPVAPRDFLVWLASPEAGAHQIRDPARVVLSTIHGAKGLEWPSVVVLGACEGHMPPSWARTDTDKAEWARALYVALTRAASTLHVLSPTELRGKPREPCEVLVKAGLVSIPI